MNTLEFSALVGAGSFAAGLLGSLTGLGGGVVLVPLLTLGFGVDLRYAMGASLVSVIATSSGAASAYVKEGYSNIRVGMFLEIATSFGALLGAYLAGRIGTHAIAIVFGLMLLYSAVLSFRPPQAGGAGVAPNRIATLLKLDSTYPSTYPSPPGLVAYRVQGVPLGFGLMLGAGTLSGLLGIGSGALKVLAMDRVMRLPFKVSTTTSNFMIGVTACASAGIYFGRGYIDPALSMPVMLGVLAGSLLGTRILTRAKVGILRTVFGAVILALGVEMIWNGIEGKV